MKILVIFLITLISCSPKVEFYLKGRPCYTRSRCISYTTIHKCDYHFGYNPLTGREEYFFGDYTEERCDTYKIDTLYIKPKR